MASISTRDERQARASATIELLKDHLPAVLQDRPVMLAYVYGSIAEGCPLPTSDVDIALVWMPDCEQSPYERFQAELDIELEIKEQTGIQNADVRSIIEPEFRATGHRMVRMRKRLVRLYWEVDADILYDTLQRNLTDFDRFKDYIYRYMQTAD